MEKNIIKEEIVELLEIIVEQSEIISSYNKQIPQIELDIVLSNIRELYEKYKILEKVNNNHGEISSLKKEEKIKTETIAKPLIKEEKTEEEQTEPEPPVAKKEIKIKENIVVQETLPLTDLAPEDDNAEESKPNAEQDQSQKKSKTKKTTVDLFSSHATVADKFKDDKRSLNEKLSTDQADKSIAAKLQKNPIKDLKAAIGINEKFKFINELFEGNLQKYNEGITKLNGFDNLAEAKKFLTLLKEEFSWGNNSEAYLELTELISRRYQN